MLSFALSAIAIAHDHAGEPVPGLALDPEDSGRGQLIFADGQRYEVRITPLVNLKVT